MDPTTIAAVSTPLGTGGIGIIRISGPDAYRILKKIFVRSKAWTQENRAVSHGRVFSSHLLYHGYILHPLSKVLIDEVLAVYMKSPKSFTREDVVEIHAHAGFVVLDKVLGAVVDAGAELAEPGEFTKRAFLNGRIDLTQAEAVIDLINAPCETAAVMAGRQVAGGMSAIVARLFSEIAALEAACEATIEFPEEMGSESLLPAVRRSLNETVLPDIRSLIKKQRESAVYKEGLHLAIGGRPNVGKSTLLNKLVDKETAIVSDLPGTTRDIVREYVSISGVPVVLYDTAGIHNSSNPIEQMGIDKAKRQLRSADIVLWLLDGTRTTRSDELAITETLCREKTIFVINKMDLADEKTLRFIERQVAGTPCIRISAKLEENVEALKKLIFGRLVLPEAPAAGAYVSPTLRQAKLFEQILQEAGPLSAVDPEGLNVDLVAERLRRIRALLEEVSGQRNQNNLYDSIFRRFCIGK